MGCTLRCLMDAGWHHGVAVTLQYRRTAILVALRKGCMLRTLQAGQAVRSTRRVSFFPPPITTATTRIQVPETHWNIVVLRPVEKSFKNCGWLDTMRAPRYGSRGFSWTYVTAPPSSTSRNCSGWGIGASGRTVEAHHRDPRCSMALQLGSASWSLPPQQRAPHLRRLRVLLMRKVAALAQHRHRA